MTTRRRYEDPPHWTEDDIVRDCRRAVEAMVNRRLEEGGGPYRTALDERRRILKEMFVETNDLRTLLVASNKRKYRDALRYLAGPPVSNDDLRTLSRSARFAATSDSERASQVVQLLLDQTRFPWVAENRSPSEDERDLALQWTAGLWAVETVRTGRRTWESRAQEAAVVEIVRSANFERQRLQSAVRLDQVSIGSYTHEINLAGLKSDLSVRLRDGRLLAIECKVSNSELNSVKRLLREVGGKARQWQVLFGQQVVTAAILRGVFRPTNVVAAQDDYSIAIFWEHDLEPLRGFLIAAS